MPVYDLCYVIVGGHEGRRHCPPTPRRRFKQKRPRAPRNFFIPAKWMMTVEVRGGWLAPVPPLLLLPPPPLKRFYLTRGGRITLPDEGTSLSSRTRERERFHTRIYVCATCVWINSTPLPFFLRSGVLGLGNRYEKKTRFKSIVFPSSLFQRMENNFFFLFFIFIFFFFPYREVNSFEIQW